MPSRAEYRRNLAVESGPYVGPERYDVRAMGGSTTTKIVCTVYPIQSGIPQQDLYLDRPLFRPNAIQVQDRDRFVMSYDPLTGTLNPDLEWSMSPVAPGSGTTYDFLEPHTYADLDGTDDGRYTYEMLEGITLTGPGEMFEILGPFDSQTMHQLINDGLKQCWLVVDVPCIPTPQATRHDLRLVAPWLQDPNHVRQVGVLAEGEDRNQVDPFERPVYGSIERDGGTFYLNTGARTFNDGDLIYLRCYKRAFDHCRLAGGEYGEQSGLHTDTDEAPVERDWATASALVIAWRRFAHLLEPIANQRIIRDQVAAAVWYSDRTHQHFTAVQPTLTFRRARVFGPAFR